MAASEFTRSFTLKHLETDQTVSAKRLMSNLDEALGEIREFVERTNNEYSKARLGAAVGIRARDLLQQLQVKE
jgi:hypothetical protein